MNSPAKAQTTLTLRLKIKRDSIAWLIAAAREVNFVWNWCNATSIDASDRHRRSNPKFLSGFELCALSAGAAQYFDHIDANVIQRICAQYVVKRRAAKRLRLRWRASYGSKRSLGWIPFKAANVRRTKSGIRICGKSIRLFCATRLADTRLHDGCFAEDSCGDWWLCVPVTVTQEHSTALIDAIGIDFGLKDIAVTSAGDRLEAGRWTQRYAARLADAQRRGHKRQAKRIHRKIKRCRGDALHKFSRSIVDRYQTIIVGDVSSFKLVKTRMSKSVLDSGWGMLRTQLQYKGEHAGRDVQVVSERNTTRDCSSCGCASGPSGLRQLVVRQWVCSECGAEHDRDVNAAKNILAVGLRCRASVCGNGLSSRKAAA